MKNKYLNKFYITNNIRKSLHSKLNNFLPIYSINPENFKEAITKVFIDDIIKEENIKRYFYKAIAIIILIEEFNLNNEPKWIKN